MVALAVFWAAMFCILFFVLGTIVKILISILVALYETITTIGALLIVVLLGMIGLSVLYEIAYGIRTQGLGEMIFNVILFVVVAGTVLAIILHFGAVLAGLVLFILQFIYDAVCNALQKVVELCEKAYVHFLQVILNRVDKC